MTGLLLVAPRLPGGLTVRHVGDVLPSLPHIDMTCETLREAGIRVDQPDERTWIVHPGTLHFDAIRVEPDLSRMRGRSWPRRSSREGRCGSPVGRARPRSRARSFPELLERMGGRARSRTAS